jgi:hypothetical protein
MFFHDVTYVTHHIGDTDARVHNEAFRVLGRSKNPAVCSEVFGGNYLKNHPYSQPSTLTGPTGTFTLAGFKGTFKAPNLGLVTRLSGKQLDTCPYNEDQNFDQRATEGD